MKFKLFFLATVALIVASCTNNEIIEPEPTARIMRFTATVAEPADTRSTLDKTSNDLIHGIQFKWILNDEIQLCFEQGPIKKTVTTTVSSVSTDGRRAQFAVNVPTEIQNGTFTLYAYRSSKKDPNSGSVLDPANPTIAILPTKFYDYVANFSDQVLPFSLWSKQENITWDGTTVTTPISLNFNHLGSMMTLHLKNINPSAGAAIPNLYQFALYHPTNNWVYNRDTDGGAQFDMNEGAFVLGAEKKFRAVNFLRYIDGTTPVPLAPGATETLYIWFVPGSYTANTSLTLYASSGIDMTTTLIATSTATKTALNYVVGKNYIYFAHISGNSAPYTLTFETPTSF